ncbi:unnamed protein product [Mytilus coruscus]|uniref:Uncharacterized protein n=1 Tax=Mytilus coruscus TaxID=42192 RepID=A0A6J8EMU5_MYTCO|nr:unnamed protein product [Mytilus coruscus]
MIKNLRQKELTLKFLMIQTLIWIYQVLLSFKSTLMKKKFSLRDVPTKDDLVDITKDLVKTSDLENLVTGIVKELFYKFESSLETMKDKISKIEKEMEEKVDTLSIENEHLNKRLDAVSSHISPIKTDLAEKAKVANLSSNYNEQYSRKTIPRCLTFQEEINKTFARISFK